MYPLTQPSLSIYLLSCLVLSAMPVITRSVSNQRKESVEEFMNDMKYMATNTFHSKNDPSYRIGVYMQMLKRFNKDMPYVVETEGLAKWIQYIATIYCKTVEFTKENYPSVDANLMAAFRRLARETKAFCEPYIKNYDMGLIPSNSVTTLNNIKKARNVMKEESNIQHF